MEALVSFTIKATYVHSFKMKLYEAFTKFIDEYVKYTVSKRRM